MVGIANAQTWHSGRTNIDFRDINGVKTLKKTHAKQESNCEAGVCVRKTTKMHYCISFDAKTQSYLQVIIIITTRDTACVRPDRVL